MMSKNSFCKQVLQMMHRNLWAITLSVLGFAFCLVLPAAIIMQNYYSRMADIAQIYTAQDEIARYTQDAFITYSDLLMWILGDGNLLVRTGIVTMAVILGIALFRYLHDQRQVDLHHALPIKREQLFWVRFVSGIVMVLPVLWVMRLLAVLVAVAGGLNEMIVWDSILLSLASDTVFFVLLYAICVLCTVLTGNTVVAVVLSIWYFFFAPAFVLLFEGAMSMFTQATSFVSITGQLLITRLSAVIQYYCFHQNTANAVDYTSLVQYGSVQRLLVMFAVVAMLHIVLAVFLFKKRKSETAGHSIAFTWFKLPVKVSICAAAGLIGFLALYSMMENMAWGIFGLLLCTVIAHGFVEIVLEHDFKAILNNKKHCAGICVALVAFAFGCQNDVWGLDTYLPSAGNLKGATLTCYYYGGIGEANSADNSNNDFMCTTENMALVMQLAQLGVESLADEVQDDTLRVGITFDRAFGLPVERWYNVPNTSEVQALIDQVCTSEEYQMLNSRTYSFDVEEVRAQSDGFSVQVRTASTTYGGDAVATIMGEQAVEILQALQQESLTLSMDARTYDIPVMRLDLQLLTDNGYSMNRTSVRDLGVYPSYTQTLALIAEYSGVTPQELSVDDVQAIVFYDLSELPEQYWRKVTSIQSNIENYQYEVAEYTTGVVDETDIAMMMEEYGFEAIDYAIMNLQSTTISDVSDMRALLAGALNNDMTSVTDISFEQDAQAATYSIAAVRNNGDYVQLYYPTGAFPSDIIAKY